MNRAQPLDRYAAVFSRKRLVQNDANRRRRKNFVKASRLEQEDDVEKQYLSVAVFDVNGVTMNKLDKLAE